MKLPRVSDPGLWRLNIGIALVLSASATAGYNASQINSLLVLPEFIVSAIVQATVQQVWVFFAARVVTGIGVGFSQTAAPLLIAETAHPRHRRVLTGLYNSLWFCGSISAAGLSLLTLPLASSWSWRLPCLLQMLYPISILLGLLVMPESPRWLVSRGRTGEARSVLTRYHADGNLNDPAVQEEFEQISSSINVETDLKGNSGWRTFLQSKGDAHRLLICILLGFMQEWTGNGMPAVSRFFTCQISYSNCRSTGVTSYYLPPILSSVGIHDSRHQGIVNSCLQFWNLGFAVTGAKMSDRYGRRILWLSATTLMFIFLSAATTMAGIFSELDIYETGIAVVPMLFLFCAAYDFAYMPLFIAYPAEILPFQLRAKGLAITLTTDSLACFFNQYVNPVAFDALQWRYFLVYVACLVFFLGVVYFLFPRPRGSPWRKWHAYSIGRSPKPCRVPLRD
ncbi:hypothetical protein N7470_000380 [Penicillium chermesinum]|nr:hypothetical protein N7470_000380 [Penicillium chermesinum]